MAQGMTWPDVPPLVLFPSQLNRVTLSVTSSISQWFFSTTFLYDSQPSLSFVSCLPHLAVLSESALEIKWALICHTHLPQWVILCQVLIPFSFPPALCYQEPLFQQPTNQGLQTSRISPFFIRMKGLSCCNTKAQYSGSRTTKCPPDSILSPFNH